MQLFGYVITLTVVVVVAGGFTKDYELKVFRTIKIANTTFVVF
jgi:hypothetical protein